MKRDFINENFEDFLQSNADSFRMKAPDRVWKNISKELNKRKRRFTIILFSFLLSFSTIAYYILSTAQVQPTVHNTVITQKESVGISSPSMNKVSTWPNAQLPKLVNVVSPQQVTTPLLKPHFKPSSISTNAISTLEEPATFDNDFVTQQSVTSFIPTVIDSYTEFDEQYNKVNFPTTEADKEIALNNDMPLTIESVVNVPIKQHRKKKIEVQFHLSPTISYRKLSENKSYLRDVSALTNYNALYNSVNSMVTHKPDLGFEVGVTGKYPLSNKVKLRTGFQFNVNRYDIRAYSSYFEIATISLNSRTRVDSLNMLSSYSNVKGYKSNWLQNFSFQISVPIGLEMNFRGTDKVQFGIASTIQPTYILGDKAYLITTDYKNYTQVPWLNRRWNVNTSLEAFVSYRAGKVKWQVGPQVRYQLLSSFVSRYPVKENLFDFGLKVGLSMNK